MFNLSTIGFSEKPQRNELSSLSFKKSNLTIEDICDCIRHGICFAGIYKSENDILFLRDKTRDNFIFTQCVMLDLDNDIDVSLNELVDGMEIKPTISYTTFSHNQEGKGNRYRLLYLFDEPIFDTENKVYEQIYEQICSVNNLNLTDNCGKSMYQMFYGSREDCELIVSECTYSLADFGIEEQKCKPNSIYLLTQNGIQMGLHFQEEEQKCKPNSITLKHRNGIQMGLHFQEDDEFLLDFEKDSYLEILLKYKDRYPFFESTVLPEADEHTPCIMLPDDYMSIKRRTYKEPILDSEGNTKSYAIRIKKLENGQHRRDKLYINALLRRKMLPSIDFNHLLYCLVFELYHYVWNLDKDDMITKDDLKRICQRAMDADLSRYQALFERNKDKRKFIANPAFCENYGISRRSAANIGRKEQNRERFLEVYDPELTQQENLKRINDAGIKMSLRTLKARCKECGLTKYKMRQPVDDTPEKQE